MSSPSMPYGPDRPSADYPHRSYTPTHGMPAVAPDAARTPPSARPRPRHHAPFTRQHHPRVLAALCYTVPVVPAWMLLTRRGSQRASPFVRFHAAQALVFQGFIGVSQMILYLLLVVPGGIIANDGLAIGLAVLVLALYLAQAAVIFVVWSGLMADCIRGDARLLPFAGPLALRLERFAPRAAWARLRGKPVPAD